MKGIREMAIDSDKPEEPTYKKYSSNGNEISQEHLPFTNNEYLYNDPYSDNDYNPYASFNDKKPKKKNNAINVELLVTYEEIGTTDELMLINSGKEYDQLQEKAEDKAIEKLEAFAGNDITEKYTITSDANENYFTGFDVTLTCEPIE